MDESIMRAVWAARVWIIVSAIASAATAQSAGTAGSGVSQALLDAGSARTWISISSDTKFIASAGARDVTTWDRESGQVVFHREASPGAPFFALFADHGSLVATSAADGRSLAIQDATTGAVIGPWRGPKGSGGFRFAKIQLGVSVDFVRLAPSGAHAAFAGKVAGYTPNVTPEKYCAGDREQDHVFVVNATTGDLVFDLSIAGPIPGAQSSPKRMSARRRVADLRFSRDGISIAAIADDGAAFVWDLATGELLISRRWVPTPAPAPDDLMTSILQWTRAPSLLVHRRLTVGADGVRSVDVVGVGGASVATPYWSPAASNSKEATSKSSDGAARTCVVSGDARFAVASRARSSATPNDAELEIVDLRAHAVLGSIVVAADDVPCRVAFADDGNGLAIATNTGTVAWMTMDEVRALARDHGRVRLLPRARPEIALTPPAVPKPVARADDARPTKKDPPPNPPARGGGRRRGDGSSAPRPNRPTPPPKDASPPIKAAPGSLLDLLTGPEKPTNAGKQPGRRPMPALDLSDDVACAFELAEIASLPYYLETYHGNAAGYDRYSEDPVLLDRSARLWRLTRSTASALASGAETVKSIWSDNWRLFLANRDFGLTPENQSRRTQDLLVGQFASMAVQEVAAQLTRDRISTAVTGPNGKLQQIEQMSNEPSALEVFLEQDRYRKYTETSSAIDRMRSVSEEIDVASGILQDRLNNVWREGLSGRLVAARGVLPATTLLNIVAPADLPGMFQNGLAAVGFRNAQKTVLTRVLIALTVESRSGELSSWYGFVPRLSPGETLVALPACTAIRFMRHRTSGRATFSAWSDQGSQEGQVCETAAERVQPNTAAEARADAACRQELESLNERAPKAERQMQIARARYGEPADPVATRWRLAKALRAYPTQRIGSKLTYVRVAPFDDAQDVVSMTFGVDTDHGMVEFAVDGRFEEEVGRGSVIAINIQTAIEPVLRPSDAPGADVRSAVTSAAIERWKRREVWLLTSPFDIAHMNDDGFINRLSRAGLPESPEDIRLKLRRTMSEKAESVMILGPNDKILFQN